MTILTTPWVRAALTPEDRAKLDAFRSTGPGHLSLLADSAAGPFIARLSIPGCDEIRVEGRGLEAVLRVLIAEVLAA